MTSSYIKNGWEIIPAPIYDTMGNLLTPGSIVAYPAGTKLKFGVYEGVARVLGYKSQYQYRMYLCTANKGKVRRNMVGYVSFNNSSNDFDPAEAFVEIKNPLYHLDNPNLSSLLQAIDKLKDEGILDKNFKLT